MHTSLLQKSFTYKQSFPKSQDLQKEWRSITPERNDYQTLLRYFQPEAKDKLIITEPNDNATKSISQEKQVPQKARHSDMRMGHSIKRSEPEVHTHKASLSSNITRKNLNKLVDSFADDIKRGTETERGHIAHTKQMHNNILEALKQQPPRPATMMSNSKVNEDSSKYANVFTKKQGSSSWNSQKSSSIKPYDQKVFNSYMQSIKKKTMQFQMERSPAQENLRLGSSGIELAPWSSEKQDLEAKWNLRVSSYYHNPQSQSQSSFHNQNESENTTSRNNRVVIQNYIKERTPTKNLVALKNLQMGKGPIFVSNSKINSLLSSLTKLNRSSEKYEQLNEYSVQEKPFLKPKTDTLLLKIVDSKPIAAVEDPNHTHVILACKDHTIRIYNTCTRKTNLIGKHARQVTALSNITFERQRVFFSGSRDSVIKQWVCDSIHGNYRQEQQFRLKAPALKLILDRSYLCIITASEILRRSTESNTFVSRTEIKGQYRTALQTPSNEILIAINNRLYRFRNGVLVLQGKVAYDIEALAYQSMKVFVLCVTGEVFGFEEGPRLRSISVSLTPDQTDSMFRQKEEQLIRQVDTDFQQKN